MLAQNLKYLRKQFNLSQQELSEIFDIPRTTLGDYERGKTEPNVSNLVRLSNYFKVSLDSLLTSKLQQEEFKIAQDDKLKVLAVSIDSNTNQANIELVDTKAEAGYLESFSDPEYIRDLPKISLPRMTEGTFRGFEIQGDSMLPLESGTIIITQYVESIDQVKDDKTYIVVSRNEGLVYKRVRKDETNNQLILISDNTSYLPYSIPYEEVHELWQYQANISFNDDHAGFFQSVESKLSEIKTKVDDLHRKLV